MTDAQRRAPGGGRVRRTLRNNGLLLTCLGLFGMFFIGMIVSGWHVYNQEQLDHGNPEQISLLGYLTTGAFVEATFENWESEFLQMGMYIVLTAFLFQKGSSESKPIDKRSPQDINPRTQSAKADAPWPVRHGGWALFLYENSLAAVFFILFFLSLALHALGGARAYSEEQ